MATDSGLSEATLGKGGMPGYSAHQGGNPLPPGRMQGASSWAPPREGDRCDRGSSLSHPLPPGASDRARHQGLALAPLTREERKVRQSP